MIKRYKQDLVQFAQITAQRCAKQNLTVFYRNGEYQTTPSGGDRMIDWIGRYDLIGNYDSDCTINDILRDIKRHEKNRYQKNLSKPS